MAPTFLYIGASRAGSSWIFEILREHPEVFVPDAKDLMFFDLHYQQGLDWYLSFFSNGRGFKARGELTHDYFLSSRTADRIRRVLPDVKLLCCLREPVEKTRSLYHYNRTTTFIYHAPDAPAHKMSFDTFASLPEVRKTVDYYGNLKPFFERFAPENIRVLFYDDLKRDAAAFARTIFEFLDVDPTFTPPSLQRRVNAAREARILPIALAAYKIGRWVRKLGLPNVVGSVKRNNLMTALLYRTAQRTPEVSRDGRESIFLACARDYDNLERLIGRPLPDSWRRVMGSDA